MRLLRSPVSQILAIGVVAIIGMGLGSNYLADRAALDEAIVETQRTTEALAKSVGEPSIPQLRGAGLPGNRGAADRIGRTLKGAVNVDQVEQVILWDSDGYVLYSNAKRLAGQTFSLDDDHQRVLRDGGTGYTYSDDAPDTAQAFVDDSAEGMIRTYTRIQSRTGRPLLFETYNSAAGIEKRADEIFGSFRWIAIAPVVLLILPVTVIISLLTRQVTNAARERERLLRSAIDASDAERRRIARDLHDGVVQELAGTAFSVSALVRDADTSESSRPTLRSASVALRDSLKSLRSLLAEIHPPELHPEGLPAALDDLIAPAAAAGIQASVSIEGESSATDAEAALVWRVAQEAVRNAIRHSGATTLAVTVRGDGEKLTLGVVDDGAGFDPDNVVDPDRYGLRGLRSLVRDVGGELEVLSAPGEGTTVRMEVDIT
ncbi:MAG: sensor histidine kinase [Actinomycetota bacterium]|nr:sensor histidine kinase [Actinomycetota bacterium]